MLDERIDALKAVTSANHQGMRRLLGALSSEDFDRKTEIGRSVRAVADHIARAPSGDVYVVRRLAGGKSATIPASSRLSIRRAVEAEPQGASGL